VKRYEEVIQSTASIVKSKSKEWYKIGTDNVITVADQRFKLISKGYHYFTWVTCCLEEIVKRWRLVEAEGGNHQEIKFIYERSPEMNKLLNVLLPKGDAQKFTFDQRKMKKTMSEFPAVQTSIVNHLVRKTFSGGEERM
jgi:hypothetical protein